MLLFLNVTLFSAIFQSIELISEFYSFLLKNSLLSQDKTDDWTGSIQFHLKLPVIVQSDR